MKNLSLIITFFVFGCRAEIDSDAIMVGDVIHSMERPSAAVATLCWPLHKKVHLYTNIAGENFAQIIMIQFVKSDQIAARHAQDQHIIFIVDLSCPNISNYLRTNNEEKHFRSPFRWILIENSKNDPQSTENGIPDAIANVAVLPDAEVIIARRLDDETYRLRLIYKISTNSSWRTEGYGYWSIQNRLEKVKHADNCLAVRRLPLDEFEIPICYVLTDNDSINHLTDGINDHIDTITKVNFPTTNHLLDFLNARRKYLFTNTWGYRHNSTWNGMTGFLVREEAEIGGSPMFFTFERISVVDYISSPTPTRSKFVFQQPKLSYENNLFLLSFRTTVWYSVAALILILFLTLFIVAFWEWKKEHLTMEKRSNDDGILRANVTDIIMLILGAACQQGSTVELKGTLGRVVMLILFMALMFLYTSYSANIVALLQSSSSQIHSLEDLLNSRIKLAVHDTVFNRYYFSTATEPTRKAIYEQKISPPGAKPRFMTIDDGVKNMQKGLFAFHMETGVGYKFVGKYFQETEKCGLKEIEYLQVIDPWLAVRKNTPYKEMYKIGLKRIQEHGLQSRENHLLYQKRPKCSGRGSNFVSVSMVDCYPALLVLSYGVFISIALLILEMMAKRKQTILKSISCRKN